ncbi:PREDICTED: WAT1-related protein At2g37460-like [Tarenaya hassleriana]|uniref:WAT1-related protein At2g37460-like n=1 Tax=Tarenaya hassleriana TaxID=28532 RepID=UPI0008FCF88A|nr:PREDICTED: WAT1-related protein At2g37460-like [Tarenaya hassleriana]
MTLKIFIQIALLGLLEPVIGQNFYYLGMKCTTATFAAAMYNILPAVTFVMAYIFRLEKANLRCIRGIAKIIGTAATVAGAMVMTLLKGPVFDLWKKGSSPKNSVTVGIDTRSAIEGAVLITVGCLGNAGFMILQAITIRSYPAELSLTAWICFLGTIEGAALALIMVKGDPGVWAIGWDNRLITCFYNGIVCSGLAYYIGGLAMKDRGPVFVNSFSPLCMMIVAFMSSIIFKERMYLGMVLGVVVICAGLYAVIWGKEKDYESSNEEPEQGEVEMGGNGLDHEEQESLNEEPEQGKVEMGGNGLDHEEQESLNEEPEQAEVEMGGNGLDHEEQEGDANTEDKRVLETV